MKDNSEEFKETTHKFNLSKYDYDLYNEEDNVAQKIIRVKSFSMPNQIKIWKIIIDDNLIFQVESYKVSKKELSFLDTTEGFQYILKQAKAGIKSFSEFKSALKESLSTKSA